MGKGTHSERTREKEGLGHTVREGERRIGTHSERRGERGEV